MTPESSYVDAVLAAFRALPSTSGRSGPADRRLAHSLYAAGIEISLVHSAFLLGTVRRLNTQEGAAGVLPPVRSLAYFITVLDEVRHAPLDPPYIAYLKRTLRKIISTRGQKTAVSTGP